MQAIMFSLTPALFRSRTASSERTNKVRPDWILRIMTSSGTPLLTNTSMSFRETISFTGTPSPGLNLEEPAHPAWNRSKAATSNFCIEWHSLPIRLYSERAEKTTSFGVTPLSNPTGIQVAAPCPNNQQLLPSPLQTNTPPQKRRDIQIFAVVERWFALVELATAHAFQRQRLLLRLGWRLLGDNGLGLRCFFHDW